MLEKLHSNDGNILNFLFFSSCIVPLSTSSISSIFSILKLSLDGLLFAVQSLKPISALLWYSVARDELLFALQSLKPICAVPWHSFAGDGLLFALQSWQQT